MSNLISAETGSNHEETDQPVELTPTQLDGSEISNEYRNLRYVHLNGGTNVGLRVIHELPGHPFHDKVTEIGVVTLPDSLPVQPSGPPKETTNASGDSTVNVIFEPALTPRQVNQINRHLELEGITVRDPNVQFRLFAKNPAQNSLGLFLRRDGIDLGDYTFRHGVKLFGVLREEDIVTSHKILDSIQGIDGQLKGLNIDPKHVTGVQFVSPVSEMPDF